MLRRMLRAKIHRATVTAADLNYVGSISIDTDLLALSGIAVWELVHVLNLSNGERFETYAMPGKPGEICLNGAAARLVQVGDKVIILTYADVSEAEMPGYAPTVVHVDEANVAID